ncbi:RNA-guided endonuclease IscB [Meiothermus sp. Pnk-1]|uniref:RNA-guided endonuclease IscB n=1 Tax=Meiothermus sp. Pnk-1 TaxID=873128 RepID=UPI000D7BDA6D|nr:RNA-guided endonuclease IscB [Meiothermus sp. Pnk-1]PZA08460.1 hypothetical protein DNA98_03830 [Meiothermus sp. Pnk-1]
MVFVLDSNRKPLDPCHPARARKLLKAGKAAVFRRYPFTIILKERRVADSTTHAHRVKIDPGSKVTGIAVVNEVTGRVVWAAELTHRGQQIRERLLARRQLRRARRSRKTRYRKARFNNRRRPSGWLPPSLASRVANIETWVKRLLRLCPVEAISMELVRFDTQALQNPEISGVEYQRGELYGYEVREYLLEKFGRRCAYCGKENVPLEEERQRILREAAMDYLFELMSEASEDHWAAGWMSGTEVALWKAIQQYPQPLQWGMGPIALDTVRKLRDLALAVEGWWEWTDDGQRFVPLDEWERMYAQYFRKKESGNAEGY